MANLFPEGYESQVVELSDLVTDKVIGYKGGVGYSDEQGDFIRDGKHKIVDNSGIESWKNWCVNCISTQRYAHLAYSTDFGIDIESAFKAESRKEAENILTREITEALLADEYGRTDYISSIDFDWVEPNAVQVNVTVHGIDDVTIDITSLLIQQS